MECEVSALSEVQLARWDERSYYTLSESADKSHRKLVFFIVILLSALVNIKLVALLPWKHPAVACAN